MRLIIKSCPVKKNIVKKNGVDKNIVYKIRSLTSKNFFLVKKNNEKKINIKFKKSHKKPENRKNVLTIKKSIVKYCVDIK